MLIVLNLNFGDFRVSTNTLVQNVYYLSDFYPCSTATKLSYEITLSEWLNVPNSRYHCSSDPHAFSTLA